MTNLGCQADDIQNGRGNKPLGVSVWKFPGCTDLGGMTYLICDCRHCLGWGSY